SLKSVQWFPAPPPTPESSVAATLAKLAVGGGVGALFFVSQRQTAAYVVSSLSLASQAARKAIDAALGRFGRGVGSGIGAVLLTIVYVVVVTPTRFVR